MSAIRSLKHGIDPFARTRARQNTGEYLKHRSHRKRLARDLNALRNSAKYRVEQKFKQMRGETKGQSL